jgi:hypothetical protein
MRDVMNLMENLLTDMQGYFGNLGPMESPINIVKGMICGLVFLAAVAWQIRIYYKANASSRAAEDLLFSRFDEDDRAKFFTFVLPFTLSFVIISLTALGVISYGVLATIDHRPVATESLWTFFIAVSVIVIAFNIKAMINVILLGATITWSMYRLLFYGEISFIPLFRLVFDIAAAWAPDWIQALYTILALGYAGFSAFQSSLRSIFNLD